MGKNRKRRSRDSWCLCEPSEVSLGVDPGLASGAAVWRRGDTVLAALAWTRLSRKGGAVWRVRFSYRDHASESEAPTLPGALESFAETPFGWKSGGGCGFAVIEGQYQAGYPQRDAFTVARTAGVAWACLCPHIAEPLTPNASEWRATIGAAGLDAKATGVTAWTYAYQNFAWPGALGPWFDDLTTAEAEAVAEAAVMAGIRKAP